jgi:hypothetical protein
MSALVGTPSDDSPDVLATGRCVVTNMYVSMCTRDPESRDAEYLRWHTFDHRPEQYRLDSVRGSLRLVSTPECRTKRARSEGRYDTVDHVMTYFFADLGGLEPFADLAVGLGGAGRIPRLLPSVERAVYHLDGTVAAPRIKVGADVLPWWPILGAYVIVEQGDTPAPDLIAVPGVAGMWWGGTYPVDPMSSTDRAPASPSERHQITYCFLDADPVATAVRLADVLERRWAETNVAPMLAAPFHVVSAHDLDRHLP